MRDKLDLSFVALALGAISIVTLGIVAIIFFSGKQERIPVQTFYPTTPTISNMPKENKYCEPCITKTEEVRPTRPHIINHILTEANTWYEIKFPVDMVTWMMRARGDYDLFYSFEPAHSTTMILASGNTLNESTAPHMGIKAIYVMSETANSQVDIELWRNGN